MILFCSVSELPSTVSINCIPSSGSAWSNRQTSTTTYSWSLLVIKRKSEREQPLSIYFLYYLLSWLCWPHFLVDTITYTHLYLSLRSPMCVHSRPFLWSPLLHTHTHTHTHTQTHNGAAPFVALHSSCIFDRDRERSLTSTRWCVGKCFRPNDHHHK